MESLEVVMEEEKAPVRANSSLAGICHSAIIELNMANLDLPKLAA